MDVTGVKEERVDKEVMSIPPPMLPPMLLREADAKAVVVPVGAPPIP